MNISRQALILSIAYALPLFFWLTTQLDYMEWNTASLQSLFRQTLAGLLLLQVLAISLLFINAARSRWQEDALAIIHMLFFPMPFFTLIWLTGSMPTDGILKGFTLLSSIAAVAFLIQRGRGLLPGRLNSLHTGLSLAQILPAVMLYNYRNLWWSWLGL